jgi:hypothetical protein
VFAVNDTRAIPNQPPPALTAKVHQFADRQASATLSGNLTMATGINSQGID